MTRAWLVAAALMSVMVVGCRSTTVEAKPVRAAEYAVQVQGWVIAPEDEPVMVCGIILASLPPQCGRIGFEVRGVDLASLPQARTFEGVTWTEELVALVGTLDTREFVLTVTQPPTVTSAGEPGPSREPPCDEPSGGWPPHFIDNDDVDTVRGYGRGHPDSWSGAWTDSARQVWTLSFTKDLTSHEEALSAIYDGPVCVIEADYTWSELDAVREEILALSVEPTELGPAVRDAGVAEVLNQVWVWLWLADDVAVAPLSSFDQDMISVSSWVEILD